MTRVATGSSTSIRAVETLAEARWRVGVRGSLSLSISHGTSDDTVVTLVVLGSERFVLEGRMDESAWEVRFAFPGSPGQSPSAARRGVGEPPENPPASRGPRRVELVTEGLSVSFCANPAGSGADRVLLTDLPARLGLMGGTYVLESIRTGF